MVTITKTVQVEVNQSELREELIAQIIKYGPQHFDMSTWFRARGSGCQLELGEATEFPGFNECGTTACLAGHAAHLAVNVRKFDAQAVEDEHDIAGLFGFDIEGGLGNPFSSDPDYWPLVMSDAYNVAVELGDDTPVAEWRAALAYLISLRD